MPPTPPNYEVRVGIFSTIALMLLLWGWGWLKSISLFHPPQRFIVQFHDIAGLNKNATVNINGVRVGVVEKIELKSAGQVLVYPKITEENVVVTRGSHITIQTLGLVGAKYIEVSLPRPVPGEPAPPPLAADEIVIGEDPVRIELILSDIGTFAKQMVGGMAGERIGTNLGVAVKNIGMVAAKVNENMDNFKMAAKSVSRAADKFGGVADKADTVAGNADNFFTEGQKSFSKVNKILDKPMFSTDLKDIVDKAKQASDQIANAVHEINSTLKDDKVRHDLLTIMDKLGQSTDNIAHSMQTLDGIARNNQVRSDIKDIIMQAKDAISKVNATLDRVEFKDDLPATMRKVKAAAADVDTAAIQLQQVLNKRSPLLHIMFGRPGKIHKKEEKTTVSPGTKSETKSETEIDTKSGSTLDTNTEAKPMDKLERLQEPILTPGN